MQPFKIARTSTAMLVGVAAELWLLRCVKSLQLKELAFSARANVDKNFGSRLELTFTPWG
jgi:hypothetical protein